MERDSDKGKQVAESRRLMERTNSEKDKRDQTNGNKICTTGPTKSEEKGCQKKEDIGLVLNKPNEKMNLCKVQIQNASEPGENKKESSEIVEINDQQKIKGNSNKIGNKEREKSPKKKSENNFKTWKRRARIEAGSRKMDMDTEEMEGGKRKSERRQEDLENKRRLINKNYSIVCRGISTEAEEQPRRTP